MTNDNSNPNENELDSERNNQISDQNEIDSINIDQMIGTFGRWQLNVILFYIISYILSPINNLGYVIQSAKTDLTCIQLLNNSLNYSSNYSSTIPFSNEVNFPY